MVSDHVILICLQPPAGISVYTYISAGPQLGAGISPDEYRRGHDKQRDVAAKTGRINAPICLLLT